VRSFPSDGDDAAGPGRRGAGQALGAGRSAGVSGQGQVRKPGLAHAEGGDGPGRGGLDRMKPIPVIQAPPPGVEIPEATNETASLQSDPGRTQALKPAILDAIRTVFDPEIPVNILELGLIYDVLVDAGGVAGIRMTLTAPGCPAARALPVEVARKVKAVEGVTDARVDVVWDPPWTKDRMSDAAKLQLGMWWCSKCCACPPRPPTP